MYISTLSTFILVLVVVLVVLAFAALGSLFTWVTIEAWRHIMASGREEASRLNALEDKIDALEDSMQK